MSKGTDDSTCALQHTVSEDKMGASAHNKSLEGSNKIGFTTEDREDKLFVEDHENKGSAGISITEGSEGISDYHRIIFILLPKAPSF